ncbi:MAG TPA: tetratricopeptide repeat protein [Methanospirillum sp.]|uniref:tetratricopeptide repeat protein n=1 Tax=Methanospirillum sp. TaxID=45200 RepID=UPI002CB6C31E|nr:tetratricopeptide repeat protein [Methanospirillum sp.]HWQ63207.1 tetratricopeptide repeat protein [Methanospirillum sp.]
MSTFQEGIRLYKEGRYAEAVEKLHAVTIVESTNHKAWNALGVALSKTGDNEQSVVCFENALQFDGANKTYLKNLDRAKTKRFGGIRIHPLVEGKSGDSKEINRFSSQTILDKAQMQTIEPVMTETSIIQAPNYVSSGSVLSDNDINEDQAKEFMNRALSLFGQASYHEMPDLMQETLSYIEKAISIKPDYYDAWQLKVSILISTGLNNGEVLVEALDACEHALAIKPDQAAMWFNKAGILESLGRNDEAISAYNQSYLNSSDEPMRLGLILMKKGAILEAAGQSAQALEAYGQVPVQDRFFGDAMERKAEFLMNSGEDELAFSTLRTAGMSYLKSSQYEKALQVFDHLLSINTNDDEISYNKGVTLLALYERNQSKDLLEDALQNFDIAVQAQPDNMSYLIQKGRCLLDLGRFEEGLQYLDRALWINPDDGITLMNKGIALYQLSRHEEALRYFDLVCSHYPEHSAAWIMKSRIHLDWKQYDTALMDIEEAIRRSEDEPRAFDQRAIILRALGREKEADEDEKKARNLLEMTPE